MKSPLATYALVERPRAEIPLRQTHRSGIGTARNGCRGFKGPVPPPLWMSALCTREVDHKKPRERQGNEFRRVGPNGGGGGGSVRTRAGRKGK